MDHSQAAELYRRLALESAEDVREAWDHVQNGGCDCEVECTIERARRAEDDVVRFQADAARYGVGA